MGNLFYFKSKQEQMADPPKGRVGMTQVEENACWRERVAHENKKSVLNENFDFNPKNLIAISEKPTQMKAKTAEEMKATEADLKILKDKLDTLAMLPKKKFAYPVTSAQELGWDMDTEFNTYKPKYTFNKAMCTETKYADSYVTMTKTSPYAARKLT